MAEVDARHEEPALERAVIYRGPQAPVLQAYVPLPVFGAECMLLLLCMRLFGFWTLLLLPLHLVLVLKTNDNPFWVRDLVANLAISETFAQRIANEFGNKGFPVWHGKQC